MDSKAKRILTLFLTFFKIGAFTFGGGYAMIPLIQREVSEKRKWITVKETVKGNSATVINLRSGTEYTFAVRPYVVTEDNRIIRSDSYKKKTVYTLLPYMNFNIRRYTADSTEISWSSLKDADGYQVWYCVQGDKEYKKLGNFKGNKARHVKLKKGKTYTVKVTYLKDTIKTTVKVK